MSEGASIMALLTPGGLAVLAAWLAGKGGRRSSPVALLTIGIMAVVVGFFGTFTAAWSVSGSAILVWLTSIAIGVLVGLLGHLVTRENAHG